METTTKEQTMTATYLSLRDFASADLDDLFAIVSAERTALRNARHASHYEWAMMRLSAAKQEIQTRWLDA